jgi:hypothetical protein
MADVMITKAALTPGNAGPSQTANAGPSKFDVIKSQITQQVAADVKVPAGAPPFAQLNSSIETGLKQQLAKVDSRSAMDPLRRGMKNTRVEMDKPAGTVGSLPPQSSFSPFRERLNVLEQQFQKSGDLIQGMSDMDPKSLLNVQMQLYQLSGNIELMSKLVDQASSGVKTMLQVQV